MPGDVIDASFASKALIPSQVQPVIAALLRADRTWSAPHILRQEFFNAVRRAENRRLITLREADDALNRFERLAIEFLSDEAWVPRALALSRRYNQRGIFDAIYFVCASDLGVQLWTADGRFVRSFGVERPANLRFAPEDAPAYLGRSP